jgi:hypothetical protein
VDDAGAVRASQRSGDFNRACEGLIKAQRSTRQPRRQGLALQQLEDQIVETRLEPNVMNGADVRVVERGNRARFALEALAPGRIDADRRTWHLDGHVPSEAVVAGLEQFAHPAAADGPDDFIGAETCPW